MVECDDVRGIDVERMQEGWRAELIDYKRDVLSSCRHLEFNEEARVDCYDFD